MDTTIPSISPESKPCTLCKQVKPLTDFHKYKHTSKNGVISTKYVSQCKECVSKQRKEEDRRRRINDKRNERRQRQAKEGIKRKKYPRKKYPSSTEYNRMKSLREDHGMTVQQYNTMLANQNGVCAICKKPESVISPHTQVLKKLAVDHCHKTGKIRGLLCDKCNRMLGCAKDDRAILHNAIEYLSSQ